MLQRFASRGSAAIHTFIDPAGRGRAAVIALILYSVATAIGTAVALANDPEGDAAGIAALVQLVFMVGAFVLALMWVHRVNANAHSFADGLSVTPGWNVGWFFVPFANLWKPFEGVRETWQASENPENWPSMPVPVLLRAWWGCWLAGTIIGNGSFQIGRATRPDNSLVLALDGLSSLAMIGAATLLILIIRQLTPLQRHAHASRVFA